MGDILQKQDITLFLCEKMLLKEVQWSIHKNVDLNRCEAIRIEELFFDEGDHFVTNAHANVQIKSEL
ncbi:MAG: hypothetical protein ACI8ZB_002187 [Desulforhopalus sp.]|jgi:hypothetical protein